MPNVDTETGLSTFSSLPRHRTTMNARVTVDVGYEQVQNGRDVVGSWGSRDVAWDL